MTDSKKTEPVDNFPYLVYTDEAGRTYDGNGGGGGGGGEKRTIYLAIEKYYDDDASAYLPAVDFVDCYKVKSIDFVGEDFVFTHDEIALTEFEQVSDGEKSIVYKCDFECGAMIDIEIAASFDHFDDSVGYLGENNTYFPIVSRVNNFISTDDAVNFASIFTIPLTDFDYSDIPENTTENDLQNACVPWVGFLILDHE